MKPSLLKKVLRSFAVVASFVLPVAAGLAPTRGWAQTREKVTFAISYSPMGAMANYLYPASFLKYWEQEGLDVELITTQGTGQVLQMLAAGSIDMGLANPEPYIVARATQNLPARSVGTMGTISTWSVGTLPNSSITTIAQLKGKSVGVTSLASGGVYFLKARAIESGLNPDDITLVPVGFGASANDAVVNGKVDAMLLWRSGFATVENIGTRFKFLPRAEWEDRVYSLLTLASAKMIDSRPDVVAKVLRGIAMSMEFSATRPEAAAMVFEKAFPENVSRSVDAKTNFNNNLRLVKATLTDGGLMSERFPKPPMRQWGAQSGDSWSAIQTYMAKAGLIKQELPADALFTDRFTAEANKFDRGAVARQAKTFPVAYQAAP